MESSKRATSTATLAGTGAIAFWSFSGVCYGAGGRTLGAMPFLCISSAVGVATIVMLHAVRRRGVLELFQLPPRAAVAGFFGIVVYSLLLGSAMSLAAEQDLAHIMLLNYLWPIWIVLLSLWLLPGMGQPWRAIGGAALGFGGILIARGPEVFKYPASALMPHAMAAVGGVLWAGYSVLLRRWKLPPERGGSTFQFAMLTLVSGALALCDGSWQVLAAPDATGLLVTILAGIGPCGLGYFWWEIGMKRGSVHTLAVLSYFIPIVSAVLIGMIFRRAMGPLLIPGAAMIALGAWMGQSAGGSVERAG